MDATLITNLTTLGAAVAGAVVGGACSFLASYLIAKKTAKLSITAQFEKEHRDNLQRIAVLSATLETWIEKLQKTSYLNPSAFVEGDPSAELQILAILYFPELADSAAELRTQTLILAREFQQLGIVMATGESKDPDFSKEQWDKSFEENVTKFWKLKNQLLTKMHPIAVDLHNRAI